MKQKKCAPLGWPHVHLKVTKGFVASNFLLLASFLARFAVLFRFLAMVPSQGVRLRRLIGDAYMRKVRFCPAVCQPRPRIIRLRRVFGTRK